MNNDRIYYTHNAEMPAMRDRTVLALVLLTLGAGIGATLALLFAPSSGKTVRHDLAKNFEEGLNTGRETVEPLVKRLEEKFAELRESVDVHLK